MLQSLEAQIAHYEGQRLSGLSTEEFVELENQLQSALEKIDNKINQKSPSKT